DRVATNMVVVDVSVCGMTVTELLTALKADGVLAGPMSATSVRFVTHKDVDEPAIDGAIAAFARSVSP
ncbi:MAG: low specificity L-threonine aldolase, partial [Actinomycetota bacterium]